MFQVVTFDTGIALKTCLLRTRVSILVPTFSGVSFWVHLKVTGFFVTAHARLMFRNEVNRLDALAAILCIESSMTTSAIVDSVGNALHSKFTEVPDVECILNCLTDG